MHPFKTLMNRQIDERTTIATQRNLQVTSDLIQRLALEKELEGHHGCVNCLEWNDKGSLLASGSDDVQVIVWDPFRYKSLAIIRTGHQGNIFSVKFLPNSSDSVLVTGAADCKIRVHDLNLMESTHVFSHHAGRVKRIATAPNVPFMFWSAAEDGTVMQFDLRAPEVSSPNPRNILVNLNAHMGEHAEAKCLAINPLRPELLAVGSNDPYVRMYDRRHLRCTAMTFPGENNNRLPWEHPHLDPLEGEDYSLPDDCVTYFVAGHLPQKQGDYRRRYRTLASTYLTFGPDGQELLVNLGGEQIYLFDINSRRKPQKFDLSMFPSSSGDGTLKESKNVPSNGFNLHRNGASNGVTNGVKKNTVIPAAATVEVSTDAEPVLHDSDTPPKSQKRHCGEARQFSQAVELLKKKGNKLFEMEHFTKAILLYNQAISLAPNAPTLYGNRAAAYMKRKWDGDLYAALRDCHMALQLEPGHLKAHFRLARCLYELNWPLEAHECLKHFKDQFPDYTKSHACETLDRDINAAIFSRTEDKDSSRPWDSRSGGSGSISEQEQAWRDRALDYELRFCGHCNTTTDIKEANFFGSNGQYIVAGSDDGSFFVWEKNTTNIVRVLRGDDSIVNCLQPHPFSCLLATSGIDPVVRLWSPGPEDGSKNDREVDNSDDAALANQRRMNADPLEVMLMNMGYRISGFLEPDEEDGEQRDNASNCHPN